MYHEPISWNKLCLYGCNGRSNNGILWGADKESNTLVDGNTIFPACSMSKFLTAFHGRSDFMQEKSAREMAKPVDKFLWTGLGVFINGKDTLISQGWGENGQCMMKVNCNTEEISVVMTNRNSEVDQAESGVEWLVNRKLSEMK